MKKIFLAVLLMSLQYLCFPQNRIVDSLKTELANAKADTTKLKIYLSLGEACERKDNLLYAEPALKLVDKLFLKQHTEEESQKLFDQEHGI